MAEEHAVDLRSDALLEPTAAMRAVLAAAPVGNDAYGEDLAVRSLEEYVADLFGLQSAVFVPTTTMANLLAVLSLCPRGGELLTDAESYLLANAAGGIAAVAGVQSRTVPLGGAGPALPELAAALRPSGWGTVPTSLVSVENTHARAGGAVLELAQLREVRRVTRTAGVALHCDWARIWHAGIATGTPWRDYGAEVDTLAVSVSKALGAPVGALLLCPAAAAGTVRGWRKQLGGGWRGAGVLAAAAEHAVRTEIGRLAEDHAAATEFAAAVEDRRPGSLAAPVRTNIVLLRVADSVAVHALAAAGGVGVFRVAPDLVRAVTHRGVTIEDCRRAAGVVAGAIAAADRERRLSPGRSRPAPARGPR